MPFFHDQSREQLRRMYIEAWRKHRAGRPMEPLEAQIADVIELHPEYHELLEDPERALAADYSPERGQLNPFLHMGIHLSVREQVGTNRPAGIRDLYVKLANKRGVMEAEHIMGECLGEAMWQAQRSGLPPDEQAYLEAIRRKI